MKSRSIWQVIAISGALSAVVYLAHVVAGGLLWPGYSHIRQMISDLTGDGAPNAVLLIITEVASLVGYELFPLSESAR